MKIESSNVSMYSQRTYQEERIEKNTLSITMLTANVNELEKKEDETFSDLLNGKDSTHAETNLLGGKLGNSQVAASDRISTFSDKSNYETIRRKCIIYLLQLLCKGEKTENNKFKEMLNEIKKESESSPLSTGNNVWNNGFTSEEPILTLYGLSRKHQVYTYESENTNFQAKGIVRTADGREISFNMDVSMSREFSTYLEENYELPTMVDPLVINLEGSIPSLSDQKFMFDLDGDGTLDRISMLDVGSGFLALDKNQDGKINDGTELFGTSTGDGFRDLARYDEDGNGWIDEADPIFEKLMIWTKDENGNDELYSLKQAGVGAICLQKAETDFSLTDIKNNQLNGKVRSTGFFLYENGNSGILQHMDIAT